MTSTCGRTTFNPCQSNSSYLLPIGVINYCKPNIRLTRLASAAVTKSALRKFRLRSGDFFSRIWLRNARFFLIFPVPVSLNLFAAPRWVFIFAIVFSPCHIIPILLLFLFRRKNHDHVSSFNLWLPFQGSLLLNGLVKLH